MKESKQMEQPTKLDPFAYGKLDVVTTLVQIATAVAGIIMAINGNTTGLLALGSLAGGVRGNLLADLLKMAGNGDGNPPSPKGPGALVLALVFVTILLAGCGGINKQFIIDTRQAITAEAGDYLIGCKEVTVAPAFSIDFSDSVTYGGGVFAGCEENGQIVEFRCDAYLDDKTGKTKMKCAPLSLWKREEQKK